MSHKRKAYDGVPAEAKTADDTHEPNAKHPKHDECVIHSVTESMRGRSPLITLTRDEMHCVMHMLEWKDRVAVAQTCKTWIQAGAHASAWIGAPLRVPLYDNIPFLVRLQTCTWLYRHMPLSLSVSGLGRHAKVADALAVCTQRIIELECDDRLTEDTWILLGARAAHSITHLSLIIMESYIGNKYAHHPEYYGCPHARMLTHLVAMPRLTSLTLHIQTPERVQWMLRKLVELPHLTTATVAVFNGRQHYSFIPPYKSETLRHLTLVRTESRVDVHSWRFLPNHDPDTFARLETLSIQRFNWIFDAVSTEPDTHLQTLFQGMHCLHTLEVELMDKHRLFLQHIHYLPVLRLLRIRVDESFFLYLDVELAPLLQIYRISWSSLVALSDQCPRLHIELWAPGMMHMNRGDSHETMHIRMLQMQAFRERCAQTQRITLW